MFMTHITRPSGAFLYELRAHLRRGGLVAYPTEGSYGLGCLPRHAVGLRRVLSAKKRPQHKGLIVIGAHWHQLAGLLGRLSERECMCINRQWPAPKTLLLPAAKRILPLLRGRARSTLAVRIPGFEPARFLCHALGSALVSTSCNRAGKRPCRSEREVGRQFGRQVMIIGGRTGGRRQSSQIMDWASGKRVR